jgi:hypothetical protein
METVEPPTEGRQTMTQVRLLMQAYYEALYERLESRRDLLMRQIDPMLDRELARLGLQEVDPSRVSAYREACQAFIVERIELYNSVGLQYLFDRGDSGDAFTLQMNLDWYDSKAEFADLVRFARQKIDDGLAEIDIPDVVRDMIRQLGAYPDRSIIRDYEAEPTTQKLPDYVVARLVEQTIR